MARLTDFRRPDKAPHGGAPVCRCETGREDVFLVVLIAGHDDPVAIPMAG
jgi:hypothetical protein